MIEIQSHTHRYSVRTAPCLKDALKSSEDGSPLFYLVDEVIPQLYANDFEGVVDPRRRVTIPATEEQKSYDQLGPVFLKLIEAGFRKDSKLVVVGGGVLQDIGCFIASVFSRGVKWDLIPTTLLSQGDSCIGGKSSVNMSHYKNQLGTFYPPQQVTICTSVLKTLPADEIRSGIGEMIKIALIAGQTSVDLAKKCLKNFSTFTLSSAPSDSPFDLEALEELIFESLRIKKEFIEKDEFDQGPRNLLNYGHTFGHAFESATHYGIPHGIAVLIGISTATYFSENLGMVPQGYFKEIHDWISPYFRPFEKKLNEVDFNSILKAMKTDKKNSGGKVNCILTHGAGRMVKTPLDLEREIAPLLSQFLKRSESINCG